MKSSKKKRDNESIKICLTIAGLDPSGGAGIVADARTFTAFGCFPLTAATSLTFQNTRGVSGAVNQSAETVRAQITPLIEDFEISAVKTGMLPTAEIVEIVAELVKKNKLENLVIDTVLRSTSGFSLIEEHAVQAMIKHLFPLARVITPNIPEAERLSGIKILIEEDVRQAAKIIQKMGAKAVVIKGGHFPPHNNSLTVKDFLFVGETEKIFSAKRVASDATHGTGCTFASAIAACLALGKSLEESVDMAKKFVTVAIASAPRIGSGHGPVNHSIKGFDEF